MKRCLGPCCGLVEPRRYAELRAGHRRCSCAVAPSELVDEPARRGWQTAARGGALRGRRRACATGSRAVERTVERQQIVERARPWTATCSGWRATGGEVEVQVLHVREGRVIGARGLRASRTCGIDDGDVMGSFLGQYYGGRRRAAACRARCSARVEIDDDGALEALLARARRPHA